MTDGPRAQAPPPTLIAITGATVIDATGAAPAVRTVVVRGRTVDALLAADAPVPEGARIIDGGRGE